MRRLDPLLRPRLSLLLSRHIQDFPPKRLIQPGTIVAGMWPQPVDILGHGQRGTCRWRVQQLAKLLVEVVNSLHAQRSGKGPVPDVLSTVSILYRFVMWQP